MNETPFLSGKVLKRSLPVAQNPADAGALATKRLLLPQGELTQFYDADDPVHYIALIVEFSKCRFDPADTFRFPLDGTV
jgi:hypothetical protein